MPSPAAGTAVILRAYKTEIRPNAAQRRQLEQHVGGARVAHNWVLERWRVLAGLTVMVRCLRRMNGLVDEDGIAMYWFGVALAALASGERVVTKRPQRKKVEGQTAYTEKVRWRIKAPPGPVPDRYPDSDWIHTQLTAEKRAEGSGLSWLTEVSSYVVREGAVDVGKGYEAFYRRLRKHQRGDHSECKPRRGGGCALGEPRFRSALHRGYHCDQGSAVRVTDRAIKLPGIGWVRFKERGYVPSTEERSHKLVRGGKVCGVGVSERGGRWYAAVRVEVAQPSHVERRRPGRAHREEQVVRKPGMRLGVDTGVRELVVTSDGLRLPGLEEDERILRLVRRRKLWERRMARRHQAGKPRSEQSNRWHEARAQVAKYHRRIGELRDDIVGKAVRRIVDGGAEHVVVRGPQVASMLARGHSDSKGARNAIAPRVHAARMGDLSRRLQYKVRWAGGTCEEAPKDFESTRRCSACGTVRDTDPGYEGWSCEACGATHDREENAARNLRDYTGADPGAASGRSGPENPPQGGNRRGNRSARAAQAATAPDGSETSALGPADRDSPGVLHSQPFDTHHDDERSADAERRTEQFPQVASDTRDPAGHRSQSALQRPDNARDLPEDAGATS